MIKIKRVYEKKARGDGYRVLIDRLWPRGMKKSELQLDEWVKEVAPSNELRKEFAHDPAKFKSFTQKYKKELKNNESQEEIKKLAKIAHSRSVTLLYAAHDEENNNAVVLKEVIEQLAEKID